MAIITNYVAPTRENRYAADVQQLIAAGENSAYELIGVTTPVEGKRGSIATDRVTFQNAARDAGYTAKVVENEARTDNTTRVVFILVEKRTRNPRTPVAAEKPAKGK